MGQVLANLLILALIYILVAIGIAIIFSILDILNFAHGQMYMWGAVIVYYFYQKLQLNYGLSLLLTMVIIGLLGMGFERFLFRRVKRIERMAGTSSFLLAIGTALLLENLAMLIFGEISRGVRPPVYGLVNIASITVSANRILIACVSFILIGTFAYFIRYAKWGRAMRAVAQDRDAAYLQGIGIERISCLGFGVAAALAAVAGGLLAPVYAVSYSMGGSITVKSFIMMLIGPVLRIAEIQ